jgi:phosphodiesterase/alkaline phosphatase D-like protein
MKKNLHSFLITITLLFCLQAFSNPVISAVSVSNITPTSARINFSVNAQNSTTNAFVQYNTTPTMSNFNQVGPINGNTPTPLYYDITNLIPNTLYYYAIDAYDASNQAAVTVTGTFTTGGTVPSTTNAVVSNITTTSAQINFEVNTFGIQSSIVVDYGLDPAVFYSYNGVANTSTNTPTPFSFNFTGLSPNTTYYYSVGAYSPTLNGNRILGSFTTAVLSNSDYEQKTSFSLSPNPASDNFTIEMENELKSVEIYSLQGQKVFASASKSINVSDLSSGIYLVRIEDQNHAVATQKLIIE